MHHWSEFNERNQTLKRDAKPSVTYYGTPKVVFETHVWRKMFGWCRAAKSEVSGLGLVRKVEANTFLVYDAFIMKQYCSGGWTELDGDAKALFMRQLRDKGIPYSECKFWWHTHYNFGVGWSGTDEENARRLVKQAKDWHVSTVINQMGDHLTRVDYNSPEVLMDAVETKVEGGRKSNRRRFAADIAKYVMPMNEKPLTQFEKTRLARLPMLPRTRGAEDSEDYLDGYVNYGGRVMPLREFLALDTGKADKETVDFKKLKMRKDNDQPYLFTDYIKDLKEKQNARGNDGTKPEDWNDLDLAEGCWPC